MIEFKRYQRSSRSVLELLFKSVAEYDIAIDSGINVANMHFKREAKIDKIKLIQSSIVRNGEINLQNAQLWTSLCFLWLRPSF